jgi:phospholipase C
LQYFSAIPSPGYTPPGPFPCFTYKTLRDLLDGKGISWSYYAPQLGSDLASGWWTGAIHDVRCGSEWGTNVKWPETSIFGDISGGKLAASVGSFRSSPTPTIPDRNRTTARRGPHRFVNAVGQSQYWNSTAIIVTWDDWGGFYDHVKPP